MGSDAAEARVRQAPSLALLRAHREEILRLAARRGVSNIRVFGWVARGDATPDSDIDLLVDFKSRAGGAGAGARHRPRHRLLSGFATGVFAP